jgi:alkylated DNA nucleotide flippase Atl1
MACEPTTRLELDLPAVIVSTYGRLVTSDENTHNVEDLIARIFNAGDLITLHIVAEYTGESRSVCKWIAPDSKYRTECNHVMSADGVCPLQEAHEEAERKALQPILEI